MSIVCRISDARPRRGLNWMVCRIRMPRTIRVRSRFSGRCLFCNSFDVLFGRKMCIVHSLLWILLLAWKRALEPSLVMITEVRGTHKHYTIRRLSRCHFPASLIPRGPPNLESHLLPTWSRTRWQFFFAASRHLKGAGFSSWKIINSYGGLWCS